MVHHPVFLREVLDFLRPSRGGVFVDCTVGEGGHAQALLEAGGKDMSLVGIECDDEILKVAEKRLGHYGSRFNLVRDNFSNIKEVL